MWLGRQVSGLYKEVAVSRHLIWSEKKSTVPKEG